MATTEHETAVFETVDGTKFLLVWIDDEDFATFPDADEETFQEAIEEHPFVVERNLPVVVAFEDPDGGSPRVYGPDEYVEIVTNEFDWDEIVWGHELTLTWDD
jgi:hypothetical protein